MLLKLRLIELSEGRSEFTSCTCPLARLGNNVQEVCHSGTFVPIREKIKQSVIRGVTNGICYFNGKHERRRR